MLVVTEGDTPDTVFSSINTFYVTLTLYLFVSFQHSLYSNILISTFFYKNQMTNALLFLNSAYW